MSQGKRSSHSEHGVCYSDMEARLCLPLFSTRRTSDTTSTTVWHRASAPATQNMESATVTWRHVFVEHCTLSLLHLQLQALLHGKGQALQPLRTWSLLQ